MLVFPAAAPLTSDASAELFTLDYSPLLDEFEQPHSSVPLVMEFGFIDAVFKSSKRKTGDASTQTAWTMAEPLKKRKPELKARAKIVDRTTMPPSPLRPPKRVPVEAPQPKELQGDALAMQLMCDDDRSFLFE